jgi:hypothetical protein
MKSHVNTYIQNLGVQVQVLAKADGIFHIKCYKNTNVESIHRQPQKYHQSVYIDECWSHFRLLTMKSHADTYIQSLWVLDQVLAKLDGIFHVECNKNTNIESIHRQPQKYHQSVYMDDCWSHFRLLTMNSQGDTYIQSLGVLGTVLAKSDGIFHIKCYKNTNIESI